MDVAMSALTRFQSLYPEAELSPIRLSTKGGCTLHLGISFPASPARTCLGGLISTGAMPHQVFIFDNAPKDLPRWLAEDVAIFRPSDLVASS